MLSTDAAAGLSLPLPTEIHIHRLAPRHVRFGPLLGVFISRSKLSLLRSGHTDTVYGRFQHHAAADGIHLCFFALSGIDEAKRTVSAYRLGPVGLQQLRLPLPRVIYDRSFGPGGRAEAEQLRRIAARCGMTVFNQPVKITKLQTYAALRAIPELAAIIPYSAPLTLRALTAAAKQFPVLYLKPDDLARGEGVYRIWRDGKHWVMEQSGSDWHDLRYCRDEVEVMDRLPGKQRYLLQEGLDLATYLGNEYDLRVHVQKNESGKWRMTGIVARVGPERAVITSPRSGGLVVDAQRALQHSFGPADGEATLRLVTETSYAIARAIEKRFGTCIELGIDLGVTKDKQVRLIEVNSRPLKVSLLRLHDPDIGQRIFRYPLRYAGRIDLIEGATGSETRHA